MNVYKRLSLAFKACLVSAIVLGFNLFFLVSTLSENYQKLGMAVYSDHLSQMSLRINDQINDPERKTTTAMRAILNGEKESILDAHNQQNYPNNKNSAVQNQSLLNVSILSKNGSVIVSTNQAELVADIPREFNEGFKNGIDGDLDLLGSIRASGLYYTAAPIYDLDHNTVGMLLLTVDPKLMEEWVWSKLQSHTSILTIIALFCIALVFLFSLSLQWWNALHERSLYTTVLMLVSVTQLVLLFSAVVVFQENQTESVRERASATASYIHSLITVTDEDALNLTGVENRKKLERYVSNTSAYYQAVTVTDQTGKILFMHSNPVEQLSSIFKNTAHFIIGWSGPKKLWVSSGQLDNQEYGGITSTTTVIHISEDTLLRKTTNLISGGLTMLVVSLLLTVEVLLLLVAIDAKTESSSNAPNPERVKFMRPAMFIFLFGIDLSMAFLPLHMREVYTPMLGMPMDMVLGLPISVEFMFVGIFFLLSGFWVDRYGWHRPFVIGLFLSCIGTTYSWYAQDAMQFILSRALVGTGYGMALMASQGFVVSVGGTNKKATGLANLFAGLYAGSICGAVAGSVLAEQYGYRVVFLTGAIVILAVIPYTFFLMGQTMQAPNQSAVSSTQGKKQKLADIVRFLVDPTVLSLIFLSSLPASIAVAGFIHFFTPTYLDQVGLSESSIGQILMIYGVCQIFIGPKLGKIMDCSSNKKRFVTIGNLFGSAAFLVFYFELGVPGIAFSVLLLGVSSSFVLASQSTMLLNLKVSSRLGQGVAIGIFRSSSRIGQVIGPMIFGVVLIATDIHTAVAYLGVAYFVTLLLFILFSKDEGEQYVPGTPKLDSNTS